VTSPERRGDRSCPLVVEEEGDERREARERSARAAPATRKRRRRCWLLLDSLAALNYRGLKASARERHADARDQRARDIDAVLVGCDEPRDHEIGRQIEALSEEMTEPGQASAPQDNAREIPRRLFAHSRQYASSVGRAKLSALRSAGRA
jgi:hypothetical protein